MALITFEDLPSTNTAINASNLNNNFNELNNKVIDTGWTEVTFNTGFQRVAWAPLKYRKFGSVVTITGAVNTTAETSWSKVITVLPTGYRPSNEIDLVCRIANSTNVFLIAMSDNGEIRTLEKVPDGGSVTTGTIIFITATFIVA